MKTRIIVAAIFVPILFVVLFFLPPVYLTFVVGLIVAIAAYELMKTTGAAPNVRFYIYSSLAALAVPFGYYFERSSLFFSIIMNLLFIILFIEAIASIKKDEDRIKTWQIAVTMFAALAVPYMLSSLVRLKMLYGGKYYVLLPIIVAFMSDAGAYFVGMKFGKTKIMPHLSPKKSLEGCIGGVICATLGLVIYGLVLLIAKIKANFLLLIFYGILGSAVTQLGDMAFSYIKREFGIKDYGHLIPGHGGMLDRFDSMTFTAPMMYLLTMILPAF